MICSYRTHNVQVQDLFLIPLGVVIDPESLSQKGYIQYDDDNFGIPRDNPQYQLTNNPAHEHTEPDGTLWSTVAAVKFENRTQLKIW